MALNSVGPKAGHAMLYSPVDKAVVLLGGDGMGKEPLYRLHNSGWEAIPGSEFRQMSLAAVSAFPGGIFLHGGSYDTGSRAGSNAFRISGESWLWNGKAWSQINGPGPSARDHHAMVYDSDRKRFVLFGGSNADSSGRSEFFGDTWEFDGKEWKLVAGAGPSARCHHAMVYDPIQHITLLLGGYGPAGTDDRMWGWQGGSWKEVARIPLARRASPRLTWDSKASRVILFGGSANRQEPTSTWSWDGLEWKRLTETGPPGRTVHGFAFDRTRNVGLVYGGFSGNELLGDLWTFDGSHWQKAP